MFSFCSAEWPLSCIFMFESTSIMCISSKKIWYYYVRGHIFCVFSKTFVQCSKYSPQLLLFGILPCDPFANIQQMFSNNRISYSLPRTTKLAIYIYIEIRKHHSAFYIYILDMDNKSFSECRHANKCQAVGKYRQSFFYHEQSSANLPMSFVKFFTSQSNVDFRLIATLPQINTEDLSSFSVFTFCYHPWWLSICVFFFFLIFYSCVRLKESQHFVSKQLNEGCRKH